MIDDRKQEINTVLAFIQNICEKTDIALIPYDLHGTDVVAIMDNKTGKVYAICRDKEADHGR
ncbi:hypothetical protein SPX_43550 [Sporomusa paucivorans]